MSKEDKHRMAIETGADLRTISKWIDDPMSVSSITRYALDCAAYNLDIRKQRKAS